MPRMTAKHCIRISPTFLFLISSITVPPDAATPVTVMVFRFTADQRFPLIRKRWQ